MNLLDKKIYPRNRGGIGNIILIVVGFIIIAVLIGLFARNYSSPSGNDQTQEDTEETETGTDDEEGDEDEEEEVYECGLTVISPKEGQLVYTPINIVGFTVTGACWPSFEGEAGTVKLVDQSGTDATDAIPVRLTGNWMTEKPVPFNFNLLFVNPPGMQTGILLFENKNTEDGSALTKEIPIQY